MSYTRKQLQAFRHIINRDPCGSRRALHRAGGLYYITDGFVCVVLDTPPEDFPVTDDTGEYLRDFFERELAGDHTLVPSPSTADDLKAAVRQWQEARKNPTPGVPVPAHPRVVIQGEHYSAPFDARLVLDALSSVGPKALFYLGRRGPDYSPTLILRPDAGWDAYPQAFVLPLRR